MTHQSVEIVVALSSIPNTGKTILFNRLYLGSFGAISTSARRVDPADDPHRRADRLPIRRLSDYNVLVVDRMLPKHDGLPTTRMLRADGKTTPALILSALGEVDDRIEGLRCWRSPRLKREVTGAIGKT
jgi:CheY-like chemotaxis protein